jgi:hypothetical protein
VAVTIGEDGAERFYRIWWPLLKFVNRELRMIPDLRVRPRDGAIALHDAARLRDALWDDDSLRDRFLLENPARLGVGDLETVSGWVDRIEDKFFVIRFLKRHTVFVDSRSRVFGVLGLLSPIVELLQGKPPLLVEAVLLPFERRIIADGIFRTYSVGFGAGIRRALDQTYREAREGDQIIISIEGKA